MEGRALKSERLSERLEQWVREYRDHPTRSWTILSRLIEHRGFVPDSRGFLPVPINTLADEVEHVVRQMEHGEYFVPARVLRCEWFDQHSPMIARLEHLRVQGLPMSRAGYYKHLDVATAYLEGCLFGEKGAKKSVAV